MPGVRYLQPLIECFIALWRNADGERAAGFELYGVAEDVRRHFVVPHESDAGSPLLYKGDGSVLQFSAGEPFCVNVTDFLNLNGTLQGHGEVPALPDDVEIFLGLDPLCQILDAFDVARV